MTAFWWGRALLVRSTTLYTQDLASPLTQILQTKVIGATPTDYVYGLNRLASLNGSTTTWYAQDALGSVRRTFDGASASPRATINYDPWGMLETATASAFGFTGELHDAATGLVNLRARWYSTGQGRFTTFRWRTDESDDTVPYTHHGYAYTLSNPILNTDPSGRCSLRFDPDSGEVSTRDCDFGSVAFPLQGVVREVLEMFDPKRLDQFVKQEAPRFGIPWQILAGVLWSEITLDTDFTSVTRNDVLQTLVLRRAPYLAEYQSDPGPGIGNIHFSTARRVSEYFATNYAGCTELQLNLQGASNTVLAILLTDEAFSIRTMAAIVRQLADYRFGNNRHYQGSCYTARRLLS